MELIYLRTFSFSAFFNEKKIEQMKSDASKLFDEATAKLNQAKEETYRPKEDLVPQLVCKNSQFVIENYLKGYLFKNSINPQNYHTIDELISKCKEINKRFEKVNLTALQCTSKDLETKVCTDSKIVCTCFDAAENFHDFLKKEKIID